MNLLRLGVSSCLLGEMVRYDGGHQRNRYLTEVLDADVDWHPVCPEVEIGLGIPRPTIRLETHDGQTQLMEPSSGRNHTQTMQEWSASVMETFNDLDGFILKKDSPSCGLDRVKRMDGESVHRDGQGMFAAALHEAMPWLPLIDDGRLHAPVLREGFLDHAMWMRRWREAGGTDMTAAELMDFHRRHKITYMSHHPGGLKLLGQHAANHDPGAYLDEAGRTMAEPATSGRHANALQHMAGYVSKALDDADRKELTESIDSYGAETEPLLVPLALIRHHARRQKVEWLLEQTYLKPYPKEWKLRLGL